MSCTANVLYIQFTLSGLIVKFGFLRRCVLKLMSSGCDAVYFGTCNPNYVHCFASVSTVMSKFHHRFTLVGLQMLRSSSSLSFSPSACYLLYYRQTIPLITLAMFSICFTFTTLHTYTVVILKT